MTPQLLTDNRPTDGPLTDWEIRHVTIEDDTPVDNFQSEELQRILVDPLYSAKILTPPFLVAANVGLFYDIDQEPIVPDVLLSLGVQRAEDFSQRKNRSYFVRELGKLPEVCIEIVSNTYGDELTLSQKSQQKGKTLAKKDLYAQIGVRYYVVYDPLRQIQQDMNGALLRVWSLEAGLYREITSLEGIRHIGECVWLAAIGLGLTLWEGQFEEEVTRLWLRWCDENGNVIPTGAEGQQLAEQRADAEQQRADAEQQRADAEQQRADRLTEYLRSLGIDPDAI